jgi:hypothetical protein
MMNMMNTPSVGAGGIVALWGVHMLSAILLFVGVILLLCWASKALSVGELKKWGITLVVIGILAWLLVAGMGGAALGIGYPHMRVMHMQMAGEMMDEAEDTGGMNHMGMKDDAMNMSMDDMAAMLKGKTGDEFDQAFIEGMIPHHQGAIDMAKEAQKHAKHEEIKRMADAIISAQQQEIDQMNQWMKDWGYTK